jgi:transcriptional regulator of met regulon
MLNLKFKKKKKKKKSFFVKILKILKKLFNEIVKRRIKNLKVFL